MAAPLPSYAAIISEIQKQLVGQESLVERLMVALIADGHVLLEGVPGLAKTKLLHALSQSLNTSMHRVQFTPDLLPSDIVGTEVYRPQSGEFVTRKGPVFANILLADEINRAPAKVQSALLQAMQEYSVTIGEQTYPLPAPFVVLATQNPIEQEGTYPLPEAQLDRFLMKIRLTYPSFEDEVQILKLVGNNTEQPIRPVLSSHELLSLRGQSLDVVVDDRLDRYIVSLVQATRTPKAYGLEGLVAWGASPRASLALKRCARSLAFIRGKRSVEPSDVREIAPDVLRHRIVTTFEAENRAIDSDEVVKVLLKAVALP